MSQDIEVCEPPTDSISALEFGPFKSGWSSRLAAASWDNSVRVWEVQTETGGAAPRCLHMMDSTVLDAVWSSEGSQLYMGDVTGKVQALDVATNTLTKIGNHQAGVQCCNLMLSQVLMTASWDKTAKFWDPRCDSSIAEVNLPGRAYASDALNTVAVVACSDKKLLTIFIEGGHKEVRQWDCPSIGATNSQVRAVAITKGSTAQQPVGWFLAKTDGRVIMQPVQPHVHDTWSFECHRKKHTTGSHYDLYAVNDIKMNHEQKTLATVGSDGSYEFWDCTKRSRMMQSSSQDSESITKCSLSGDGRVFAYAVGYDWSKGHEYYDPAKKPKIYMRSVVEDMKSKS
ncbi:protein Rae1-like [Drosophila kikkawai]|uniref:Protein Rae1-like n=1 Tax=Drosophila kikkawai TaxID=30033 RepID=A0A6P4I4M8_DROKI|nr:protein Rae1-like [Drosophila kikkawai]